MPRRHPFSIGTFDIIAWGLVLNFIPDPAQALSEMLRIARRGRTIGGYVSDFAADLFPTWPMRRGLRQLGASVAQTPGARRTAALRPKSAVQQAALLAEDFQRASSLRVAFSTSAACKWAPLLDIDPKQPDHVAYA